MSDTKKCNKCGEEKVKEEFSKRSDTSDGLGYSCRPCHKKYYYDQRDNDLLSIVVVRARSRAKTLGIPFTIKKEDLFLPKHCPVLGVRLSPNISRTGKNHGQPSPNSPSLDRIIPHLGYIPGNVIIISQRANTIKHNATPDEILAVGNFYKNLEQERNFNC